MFKTRRNVLTELEFFEIKNAERKYEKFFQLLFLVSIFFSFVLRTEIYISLMKLFTFAVKSLENLLTHVSIALKN
jgi:hypothetical protein